MRFDVAAFPMEVAYCHGIVHSWASINRLGVYS